MSKKAIYSASQMEALKPFERRFRQAVEAHWCSPVSEREVDVLLGVWKDLTGAERVGFRRGCGTCILHLVSDMGVVYFATLKDAEAKEAASTAAKDAGGVAPRPAAKRPAQGKTGGKAKK